jgi:type 1 glutamine amidotransferase
MTMRWLLVIFALACEAPAPISVLAFSRTAEYRHRAIEPAVQALRDHPWTFEHTEDPARIDDLEDVDVVVFLMTSGDVLDTSQQRALETYVQNGGGWVGVHSASDTEYDWPWYGGLVGAYFDRHPAVQPATVHVEARDPSTEHLPAEWTREDEWYDFRENPRENVDVTLTVDERTYEGGTMGDDHPIAWRHTYDGGRSYYTALGHPTEAWSDPALVDHVAGAIEWAAGR